MEDARCKSKPHKHMATVEQNCPLQSIQRTILSRDALCLIAAKDREHVCEESDDDVILVKDRRGRVIGFERLNLLTAKQREQGGGIPLEVQLV